MKTSYKFCLRLPNEQDHFTSYYVMDKFIKDNRLHLFINYHRPIQAFADQSIREVSVSGSKRAMVKFKKWFAPMSQYLVDHPIRTNFDDIYSKFQTAKAKEKSDELQAA